MSTIEPSIYLKSKGWEQYPETEWEDEVWLLPGRIQFEGEGALDRAFQWQRREDWEGGRVESDA
jgi:hypothetical protein